MFHSVNHIWEQISYDVDIFASFGGIVDLVGGDTGGLGDRRVYNLRPRMGLLTKKVALISTQYVPI